MLIALDKVHKIGPEKVADEMMATAGATPNQAEQVLELVENQRRQRRSAAAIRADWLRAMKRAKRAWRSWRKLCRRYGGRRGHCNRFVDRCRRSPAAWIITPARFTKHFLDELPDLGSICSGGRYDNLAELYTNQALPGIGASLGLDRLLAGMEELGMLPKVTTPAEIFIPYFDAARLHDYLRLAAQLRAAGFGVEVFPEPKKLGQQLKYADRRGFTRGTRRRRKRIRRRHDSSKKLGDNDERNRAAYCRSGGID